MTGLILGANTTYDVILNGTTPGSGFTQIASSGPVSLNGATLIPAAATGLPAGASYQIITSNSAITTTFAGYPEGKIFTLNGQPFQISYLNDAVTITSLTFFVDGDWTGDSSGQIISNPNPLSPGNPAQAMFGTNAFADIQDAINAATIAGQTIVVNAGSTGTYAQDVSINKQVNLIFQQSALSVNSLTDSVLAPVRLSASMGLLSPKGDTLNTSLTSLIEGTGSLIKVGIGSLTLNSSETLTGGTSVNAGSLILAAAGTLPVADAVTIGNTGILIEAIAGALPTGGSVKVSAGGLLDMGGFSTTLAALTGAGTVENGGASLISLTLTGASTFTGVLENGGAGALSLVVKSGTVSLGGANPSTFTGGTSITGGAVKITATGALGSNGTTDGSVSVASGTTLAFSGPSINYGGAITGAGAFSVPSGTLTLGSTVSVSIGAATIGGTLNQAGGSLTVTSMAIGSSTVASSVYNLSGGVFTLSGTVSVGSAGSGQFSLSGATANAKVTGVELGVAAGTAGVLNLGAGTLDVGASGIFAGSGTAFSAFSGGTLQATATMSDAISTSLTGSTTLDPQTFTLTFSGALSGAGALVTGAASETGTVSLPGPNTYQGGTTLAGGTLLALSTASMGTGTVTQAGGLLQITSAASTAAYPNNVNVTGTATTNLNSTTVPNSASMGASRSRMARPSTSRGPVSIR